jgi:hypothetical protein
VERAASPARPIFPKSRGSKLADDEETATARYIAANVSTQLMLKVLFELIAMMTDDPKDWRAGIKTVGRDARYTRKDGSRVRARDYRDAVDQRACSLIAG